MRSAKPRHEDPREAVQPLLEAGHVGGPLLETDCCQMEKLGGGHRREPRRLEIDLTGAGSCSQSTREHPAKPMLRLTNEIPAELVVFVGDLASVRGSGDDLLEGAESSEQGRFDA